jgi:hypothetical protein
MQLPPIHLLAPGNPQNTETSGEGRAIFAIAGFVRFIVGRSFPCPPTGKGLCRLPGLLSVPANEADEVRQVVATFEFRLEGEGHRFERAVFVTMLREANGVGWQECLYAERRPLDDMNELVEVEGLARAMSSKKVHMAESNPIHWLRGHGLKLRKPKRPDRRKGHRINQYRTGTLQHRWRKVPTKSGKSRITRRYRVRCALRMQLGHPRLDRWQCAEQPREQVMRQRGL